ncbi:hypothetical protein ES703_69746 [subsurface metagenome]
MNYLVKVERELVAYGSVKRSGLSWPLILKADFDMAGIPNLQGVFKVGNDKAAELPFSRNAHNGYHIGQVPSENIGSGNSHYLDIETIFRAGVYF